MTPLSILPERVFLSSLHPSLPFPFFLFFYFLKELIFIRLFVYYFLLHRSSLLGEPFCGRGGRAHSLAAVRRLLIAVASPGAENRF